MSQVPPQIPPQMPSNPQTVAQPGKGLAVAALILGLVGLIPMLGFIPAILGIILGIVVMSKKRPGKGMAIAGIVLGAVGLVASPIILYPALTRALEMTRRASCAANLHSLEISLSLYRTENADAYPQDLDPLVKGGLQLPKLLKCPSCEGNRKCDYFYLAPAKDAPATTMVACDFRGNHQGEMRNVLHMDGHIKGLPEAEFQQALAQPENAAFAEALKKAEGP
jgi:hypothetical protein